MPVTRKKLLAPADVAGKLPDGNCVAIVNFCNASDLSRPLAHRRGDDHTDSYFIWRRPI
jgi:hypothetical protein